MPSLTREQCDYFGEIAMAGVFLVLNVSGWQPVFLLVRSRTSACCQKQRVRGRACLSKFTMKRPLSAIEAELQQENDAKRKP